jgi:hypothetical protein
MKFLANGLNKRLALIIIGCLVGFTSCSDDEEVCTETTWYEDADNGTVFKFLCRFNFDDTTIKVLSSYDRN